jgi:hypothetical protein
VKAFQSPVSRACGALAGLSPIMKRMAAVPTGRKLLIVLCAILAGFGALCVVYFIFTSLFVLAFERGTSSEILWRIFSVLFYFEGIVGCILGLIVGWRVYCSLSRKQAARA